MITENIYNMKYFYVIILTYVIHGASLVAQTVKNPPAMQETQIYSLGQRSPREGYGWLPTPVFLPGEFHGQRNVAGCSLWGCKDLDTTERLRHCL